MTGTEFASAVSVVKDVGTLVGVFTLVQKVTRIQTRITIMWNAFKRAHPEVDDEE